MKIMPLALVPVVLLTASPALAHPKLLAATPAPNAVVKPTAALKLSFSEGLVGQFSGVDVVMTDMPGMKMTKPAKVALKAALAADRKTLTVTLAQPLAKGSYRVDWHVVSVDTHRVKGSYSFKVA